MTNYGVVIFVVLDIVVVLVIVLVIVIAIVIGGIKKRGKTSGKWKINVIKGTQ